MTKRKLTEDQRALLEGCFEVEELSKDELLGIAGGWDAGVGGSYGGISTMRGGAGAYGGISTLTSGGNAYGGAE